MSLLAVLLAIVGGIILVWRINNAVQTAKQVARGDYRFKASGEVVTDPVDLVTFTVQAQPAN